MGRLERQQCSAGQTLLHCLSGETLSPACFCCLCWEPGLPGKSVKWLDVVNLTLPLSHHGKLLRRQVDLITLSTKARLWQPMSKAMCTVGPRSIKAQ